MVKGLFHLVTLAIVALFWVKKEVESVFGGPIRREKKYLCLKNLMFSFKIDESVGVKFELVNQRQVEVAAHKLDDKIQHWDCLVKNILRWRHYYYYFLMCSASQKQDVHRFTTFLRLKYRNTIEHEVI